MAILNDFTLEYRGNIQITVEKAYHRVISKGIPEKNKTVFDLLIYKNEEERNNLNPCDVKENLIAPYDNSVEANPVKSVYNWLKEQSYYENAEDC